jgi:hypothetical protein
MVGANATLVVHVIGLDDISIVFHNVRWHRFTQLHNCMAEWIEQAYFRLVEMLPSKELDTYINTDTSSIKPYGQLHHYRIFLDETGCHELFAESAHAL